MSGNNAELARSAIEAFNRRDYDAGLACFDSDVIWTVGPELLPDVGTGSGAEVRSPPFTQVFRIHDGLITRVWLHGRRETALSAAGLGA